MTDYSRCRYSAAVFFLHLIVVTSGVGNESSDSRNDITITVASPNITIVKAADPFLCTTVDFQDGAYILTRIVPKPVPGVYFHMVVSLCKKPFGQMQERAWDCGPDSNEPMIPRLPRLPYCVSGSDDYDFSHFYYQYQGGPPDEGSLILPRGTGVPVGDDSYYKSMVIMYHFIRPQDLVNGSTAGSAVDVVLTPVTPRSPVLPVSILMVEAIGFVAPHAVTTVAATWSLKDAPEMKIVKAYIHWHDVHSTAIDFEAWIERTSGERDVILHQDPHAFAGITDVSNLTSAVVREKDRLVVQCTYNNTSDRTLRIEEDDMCLLTVYYTIAGNRPLVEVDVYSVDPVYKDCIPDPMFKRTSWQFNYEGRNSYQGATGDDCFSPFHL